MVPETPVIDVDTHIIEPVDLWTSRLPAKYREDAPQAVWDEQSRTHRWRIGGHLLESVSGLAHAGWKEFYPSTPPTLELSDPAGWDANERLKKMDRYGIKAQVIYPNLLGFFGFAFMDIRDEELRLACFRSYNDFQAEWCAADPNRLVPVALLPWWDVGESVHELERCFAMGHKGVNWGTDFEKLGLPALRDQHWDPVLSLAQEMEIPLSFHIGFGTHTGEMQDDSSRTFEGDIDLARGSILFFLGNATCIVELVMSGLCERYPRLQFISVESGFGYIPYLIEAMDWQFKNNRASQRRPDLLLPSEYFRRQIYATFWFERELDRLIDLFPDNVMFETDFPHPTSLSPGPGSIADDPRTTIENNLAKVPEQIRRKILHDTAARLYSLV